jgi:hypothetical protein
MPPRGWKNISLRDEVWREVKALVKEERRKGSIASISAFVNEAVKEKLKASKGKGSI